MLKLNLSVNSQFKFRLSFGNVLFEETKNSFFPCLIRFPKTDSHIPDLCINDHIFVNLLLIYLAEISLKNCFPFSSQQGVHQLSVCEKTSWRSVTMDVALEVVDHCFFTPYIYPDWLPEDNAFRQFLTLNIIVDIGGALLYLITAALNFIFVFDKKLLNHPQILEVGFPFIVAPCFQI